MKLLNYSSEVYKDLSNLIKKFNFQNPVFATSLENFLPVIKRAQKFLLPYDGRIFDDELNGLPNNFHLPYPEIILEYETVSISDSGEKVSGKRMILATESANLITIYLFLKIEGKGWSSYPCSLNFKKTPVEQIETIGDKETFFGKNILFLNVLPGMEKNVNLKEMDKYSQDLSLEARPVLELIEALSCSNVSTKQFANRLDVLKNKKNKKSLPYDTYRVLMVDTDILRKVEQPIVGVSDSINSDKERFRPRQHLRRGHIRTYASGNKIWVASMVINPGIESKVTKSYDLRKG